MVIQAMRQPLPWTRLWFLCLVLVASALYSLPNWFGSDPALVLTNITPSNSKTLSLVKHKLGQAHIETRSVSAENKRHIVLRFQDVSHQMQARDRLAGDAAFSHLKMSLALLPRTPDWLSAIGASPMKLGLDLRGGVHFLLNVDLKSVMLAKIQGEKRDLMRRLRHEHLRYRSMKLTHDQALIIEPLNASTQADLLHWLQSQAPTWRWDARQLAIRGVMLPSTKMQVAQYALEQTMSTLNKRINELGVAEAVVQRQGTHHISVDLPGIQDIERAKSLIGKTATLRFHLVADQDTTHRCLWMSGQQGQRLCLNPEPVLTGDAITYASAVMRDGLPAVTLELGGGGESYFHHVTQQHIGTPLAVVYVETHPIKRWVHGQAVRSLKHTEKLISVATIQSALGQRFEITGLENMPYAQNLALMLRSGALAAPVTIVQESTLGPSLGAANIHKGVQSLLWGSLVVMLFMAFYYRLFGWLANLALCFNVLLIVAVLSWIGATLTLPGIAGIVLTVGMAVDANVLINERIREELRQGLSSLAAIQAGYERAFATIVDANVTTLIVAVILFALGSGMIKGFAVTLTIGLLASMMTSVTFTKTLVNIIYRSPHQRLSIGQADA